MMSHRQLSSVAAAVTSTALALLGIRCGGTLSIVDGESEPDVGDIMMKGIIGGLQFRVGTSLAIALIWPIAAMGNDPLFPGALYAARNSPESAVIDDRIGNRMSGLTVANRSSANRSLPPGVGAGRPARLYIAEAIGSCINVMNIDGTDHQTIVSPIIDTAGSMAIGPAGKIYWTDVRCHDRIIRRSDPDGSNVEVLPLALVRPRAIEFDVSTGLMYVADTGLRLILVSSPDGTNVGTVIDDVATGEIALDTQGGRIYWVSRSTAGVLGIYTADVPDGSNPELLFTAADLGIDFISDIALHPSGQWLFVASFQDIYRIDLKTNQSTLVLTDDRSFLTVLVVDENEFCFSSSDGYPAVRCAGLDGSTVRIVADHMDSHGIAFDNSRENLYWSTDDTIQRAARATGKVSLILARDIGSLRGLALDLDHEKIYWTQRGVAGALMPSALMRSDLDGTNRETLMADGLLLDPWSIAVDALRDRLYVLDAEADAILVANLDGVESSILASGITHCCLHLAVDTETGNLYWPGSGGVVYFDEVLGVVESLPGLSGFSNLAIDPFERRIFGAFHDREPQDIRGVRSANLDSGTGVLTLTSDLVNPSALAVDIVSRRIYWADWALNIIQSARHDGSDVTTVTEHLEAPEAIAIDWRRDAGDRNGDGLVDFRDTRGSYQCLGGPKEPGNAAPCDWLDLDGDGHVDLADVAELWVQASE